MKVIFFGTPSFAVPSLKALADKGFEIGAVVTQPDRPSGRNKVLTSSPIKVAAQEIGITNIYTPKKLRGNEEIENSLRSQGADLGVVVAYGNIIPKNILDIFPRGMINLHPSLLPKYRGPTPVQSAIANGDENTAITIMLLDEEMDSGPILHQESFPLPPDKYFPEINDEIFNKGADILANVIQRYLEGQINLKEQDHAQATVCRKLKHEDAKISWQHPAQQIYNFIRAYSHEPGTWTVWKGKKIFITKAHPTPENNVLGKVYLNNGDICVATSSGSLTIERLKPEGKVEMSPQEFVNGNKDFIGSNLLS